MASSKKSAKKAAPKKAAAKKAAAPKKAASSSSSSSSSAASKLNLELSPAQLKKAEACIKKNGKVTFGIKEVSATRVPKTLSSSVIID